MTDAVVSELDTSIKEKQSIVEVAVALDRLKQNRDFKQIILEGYFKNEAVRLVQLKADPEFQTAERQQSILAQIDAIGSLNQYFQVIYFHANQALKAIESEEEERERILSGDLDE